MIRHGVNGKRELTLVRHLGLVLVATPLNSEKVSLWDAESSRRTRAPWSCTRSRAGNPCQGPPPRLHLGAGRVDAERLGQVVQDQLGALDADGGHPDLVADVVDVAGLDPVPTSGKPTGRKRLRA